jgi:hypothetical protein
MLTACGLAAVLTGCGSGFAGGTVTTDPTVVVLTQGPSAQTNDFFVAPGGISPLGVSAIAYSGSGVTPNIIPDATFTWAARYVNPLTDPPSIATYTVGPTPNGFKTCPAVPTFTPPVPILQQHGTGVPSTLYPGYTILPATQAAVQVFIGAVPGVPAPYCLVIQATSVNGNVIGAHNVVVSSSP